MFKHNIVNYFKFKTMFQGSKSHVYKWRMGSIASVLQWHCSECYLINPTEATKCARCGLSRVESDERTASNHLLLRDSLTQSPCDPRIEPSRSCSSSGSSTPPTPPPRHFINCENVEGSLNKSDACKDKKDIQLPPFPALQQNHYGTFIVLR